VTIDSHRPLPRPFHKARGEGTVGPPSPCGRGRGRGVSSPSVECQADLYKTTEVQKMRAPMGVAAAARVCRRMLHASATLLKAGMSLQGPRFDWPADRAGRGGPTTT
jgi:hypothetical protein